MYIVLEKTACGVKLGSIRLFTSLEPIITQFHVAYINYICKAKERGSFKGDYLKEYTFRKYMENQTGHYSNLVYEGELDNFDKKVRLIKPKELVEYAQENLGIEVDK